MANQIGLAAVFGAKGTVAYTGVSTTQNKKLGTPLDDEFNVVEGKDGAGEVFGVAASGRKHKITIVIVPVDPTSPSSLATAASNIKLPDPLAKVTLAGFGNSLYDGDWNYIGGGKIDETDEGFLKVTLPCGRWGTPTPVAMNAVSL